MKTGEKHLSSIFISAGDHSGDMYAGMLIREMKRLSPDCEFFGLGGARMEEEGFRSLVPISEISLIGFSEVLPKLWYFLQLLGRIRESFRKKKPRLVILVDYPGLNLKIARMAKEFEIPVLYYIAPQVWAWGGRRMNTLRRYTDRVAVIIPFEVEFFRRSGVPVDYVGHPIVEALRVITDRSSFLTSVGITNGPGLLGVFPGIRRNEMRNLLPPFLKIAGSLKSRHPDVEVVMSIPHGPGRFRLPEFVRTYGEASHPLIAHSYCVLLKSGTMALEAALLGTPMVVCYRLSWMNYLLARTFIKTKYISLVNLIMNAPVVPEFVQGEVNEKRVLPVLEALFDTENPFRKSMVEKLHLIKEKLGEHHTSAEVAQMAVSMM
jgi:lipid-A-disaccharide synthase